MPTVYDHAEVAKNIMDVLHNGATPTKETAEALSDKTNKIKISARGRTFVLNQAVKRQIIPHLPDVVL